MRSTFTVRCSPMTWYTNLCWTLMRRETHRPSHLPVFQTAAVLKRDLWQANREGSALFPGDPRPQAAWRLSALALYKRESSRSPAWLVLTFLDGSIEAVADGFTHARHRKEV